MHLGVCRLCHRRRNPAFIRTDYTDPTSCPYTPNEAHRRLLEAMAEEGKGDWSFSAFMHLTGRWLLVSALLALGLGVAFIHLFKHHAGMMTRVTIWGQVAVSWRGSCPVLASWRLLPRRQFQGARRCSGCAGQPAAACTVAATTAAHPCCPPPPPPPSQFPAAAALACVVTGQPLVGLLFGGVAALAAFVFYLWRGQIELATRLLGVSAHGLAANPGVITATIALNVASMVAIAPLCVFLGEQAAWGAKALGQSGSARRKRPGLLPALVWAMLRWVCNPRTPRTDPLLRVAMSQYNAVPPPLACRLCLHERQGGAQPFARPWRRHVHHPRRPAGPVLLLAAQHIRPSVHV